MSLSYEKFCMEADELVRRSHEVASKQEVGKDSCVATWEWRHGNRQHLDGDSYLVSTGNTRQYQVATILQPQNVKTALLEFHIVYHTIYQTPVLYFRALAVDGTPLPTSIITRHIQFPGSNSRSTFIAMESHPVLGKPFSFLHPCETAAAMQLLQTQSCTAVKVQVPQYLLSWLSLVQPLTGISPLDYYSIR
ncbi:Polysaccharide lyase [Phytophthora palmivora]|uniref:Ubiquitin-like-conjugating enzyme ATG10 n=1 Tax=Phytophthora palmivora TaxID=4796 RepID=A0A2P4YD97_9STRA|nr:Polysaccharide lyase [Phytophthora palmivora]